MLDGSRDYTPIAGAVLSLSGFLGLIHFSYCDRCRVVATEESPRLTRRSIYRPAWFRNCVDVVQEHPKAFDHETVELAFIPHEILQPGDATFHALREKRRKGYRRDCPHGTMTLPLTPCRTALLYFCGVRPLWGWPKSGLNGPPPI
jgi:hypothetical protein